MTSKSFALTFGFLAAACLVVLPGCQGSSTTTVTEATDSDHGHSHDGEDGHDHDGHDHDHGHSHDFESLSEAVAEIESLRDTIRDHFADGDADAAHGPLHEIGEVLIATEDFIKHMDDSPEKESAAAAIESLLNDFQAVDKGLHSSGDESSAKGKEYADVSDSIDQAITELKGDE